MMISLAVRVFAMKLVPTEDLVLEVVEIDGDGMHMEIDLKDQNITILL